MDVTGKQKREQLTIYNTTAVVEIEMQMLLNLYRLLQFKIT